MKPSKSFQLSHCLVSITTFLFTLAPQFAQAEQLLRPHRVAPILPPDASHQTQTRLPLIDTNQTTAKPHIQSQAPSPISVEPAASNPSATSIPTAAAAAAATTTTSTGQPPEKTWLESILIQVEENLNHHQEQHQKSTPSAADQAEEDEEQLSSGPVVSSSLAPTDSGEDPLESTTTLATLAERSNVSIAELHAPTGTQYSISGLAATVATSSGSELDTILLEEQQLVDSNNVSALVAHTTRDQATPATHWPVQAQHPTGGGGGGEPLSVGPKQVVGCDQAYTQCALRKVCAPALRAYNDDCQELIHNRTSQCSGKCLKAMIALRSSEEGDDLVNCDCLGNEYCLQSKQRGQACRPQVEQAVDPKTVVSCSTASWICLADQLCSTALDYYYRNCQSLFSQRHCSMRCNNSLSILYRQPKASKLINCHCDGSEEFPCIKYKTFTERLCLNKLPPTTQTTGSDLLFEDDEISNNNDNNHEQAGGEEGFNMTNDPETFVLGSPPSSSAGSASGSSYNNNSNEDEDEDAKAAADFGSDQAGGNEESTSGLNGIQMAEDNWIPLMSGRYFTNLHQQQMRQQEQQRQQQLLLQKPTRHRNQQQVASSSGQRKSQKNVKQKSKSNNTNGHHHDNSKRRYNRILWLASTSSGAHSGCVGPLPLFTLWASACLALVLLHHLSCCLSSRPSHSLY